jgi:hypothetical protein
VRAVKKLVCYFLIVWLALIAGGANAHASSGATHGADHASYVHTTVGDAANEDASGIDELGTADASISEACNQSHCSHNHGTALPTSTVAQAKANSVSDAPKSLASWASAAASNNIERPKWPFTTPAVVSLLT